MKKYIINSLCLVALMLLFSCEEYLDQAPEASLSEEDVFKDFEHAQGFVEEMYNYITEYGQSSHTRQDYLYGDETVVKETWLPSTNVDNGNLSIFTKEGYSYLVDNKAYDLKTSEDEPYKRFGLYNASLFGIRKANIAIANVDLMIDATEAERNVILGQAYFFRAFFHHEIMKFWGRYPYIDHVIVDEFKFPRPDSYKESALRVDEDFDKAIDLLPEDWDNESYGQKTIGANQARINKTMAYAMKGKNLLLAASPLMYANNTSSLDTYTYDIELASQSADAFAQVLMREDGIKLALLPFDRMEEAFWKSPNKDTWAGSSEYVFSGPTGHKGASHSFMSSSVPHYISNVKAWVLVPTHSFIYNNFGMANGLSIEDDLSGKYGTPTFDPANPWANRDPRFYKVIITDGDTLSVKASTPEKYKTAQLYEGGSLSTGYKHTGYLFKKFYPTMHSKWNNIIPNYHALRLHVRLTDVYLMYAEAVLAANQSATAASTVYNYTAEQAINHLRDRAGVPHVHADIVADYPKFMEELRRDRAVEMCFESHRWVDIRRWGVAHLDKYKVKTALDFPADHSYFTERLLATRVCDYPKHFWIPFQSTQTQLYEGFPQNPGW